MGITGPPPKPGRARVKDPGGGRARPASEVGPRGRGIYGAGRPRRSVARLECGRRTVPALQTPPDKRVRMSPFVTPDSQSSDIGAHAEETKGERGVGPFLAAPGSIRGDERDPGNGIHSRGTDGLPGRGPRQALRLGSGPPVGGSGRRRRFFAAEKNP